MRSVFLTLSLAMLLVGCGSSSNGSKASPDADSAGNTVQPQAAAGVAKLDYFAVNFDPTSDLVKQIGVQGPFLTYDFHIVIDGAYFTGGKLNIYDCSDAKCTQRYLMYSIQCSAKRVCVPNDSAGQPIVKDGVNPSGGKYQAGGSSTVWTFSMIPGADSQGKFYRHGMNFEFADPRMITVGFFDQYIGADFEPASGLKTELKIARLLKR